MTLHAVCINGSRHACEVISVANYSVQFWFYFIIQFLLMFMLGISQRCSIYWIQMPWHGRPLKNTELIVMFINSVSRWLKLWLLLMSPECVQKTFPTAVHNLHQPGQIGIMDSWTICVPQQKLEIHQTRLHFSGLHLSSFADPVLSAASASCSCLTEVVFCWTLWSFCASWNAFLFNTTAQRDYLSRYSVSVSFNHWMVFLCCAVPSKL